MQTKAVLIMSALSVAVFNLPCLTFADEFKCPEGTQLLKETNKKQIKLACMSVDDNGKKIANGPYMALYLDEKPWIETTYKNGKKNGSYVLKYQNGKLMETATYGNDVLIGKVDLFYDNGNPKIKGQFEAGKRVGTWTFFSEDGKEISRGPFSEARPIFDKYLAKKKLDEEGYPLTQTVFSPCYSSQIVAAQTQLQMNGDWMPKSGINFRADDQLYRVVSHISKNPIELLLDGPTQMTDGFKNSCLIALIVRKPEWLITQVPLEGYQIHLGDLISGFTLKSIGKASVTLKGDTDIVGTKITVPEFELTSQIPMAEPSR